MLKGDSGLYKVKDDKRTPYRRQIPMLPIFKNFLTLGSSMNHHVGAIYFTLVLGRLGLQPLARN